MVSNPPNRSPLVPFSRQRPFHHWVAGKDLWNWRHEMRQMTESVGISLQELDWFLKSVSELDGLALKLGSFRQLPGVAMKFPLEELTYRWEKRLKERVPVQYLAEHTVWRDFVLEVSPAVLIPRPETELIIDISLEAVAHSELRGKLKEGIWVDMGTGSGAIALGLADGLPKAHIVAVDASPEALAIAQRNAAEQGLHNRITFYQGDWFQPLSHLQGQLSAIVSNPPYIPASLLPTLQPEVVRHEPVSALDGGEDGLAAIRILAEQGADYLVSGGLWVTEMMAGQGQAVKALLEQQSAYRDIQICDDLAGLDRFVLAFHR
jgi:release factor glutamine methyltransferase